MYAKRTEAFFAFSSANTKAIAFGTCIIAATLWLMNTPLLPIAAWFTAAAMVCLALVLLTIKFKRYQSLTELQRKQYVNWRIGLGASIALLYGASAFLLPDVMAMEGTLYLTVVMLAVGAVAILQFAFFPAYYVLFNLSGIAPLSMYLMLNLDQGHAWTLFILVTATGILLLKGIHVSRYAYDAVLFNLQREQEVQEHIKTKQQLETLALNDHLTGLANRRLFEQSMTQGLHQCQRNGKPLSVIFIDLNDFKIINDRYGHGFGDQVLQAAAERITAGVRKCDLVARLGGDEFAVLLLDCEVSNFEHPFVQALCARLNQPLNIDGVTTALQASIGSACYPFDGLDHTQLMQTADRRMYQHKTSSKSERPLAAVR